MRIVLQIFAIGLAAGVLCLAVIAGIEWWLRSPKTLRLKLDSAGKAAFHGVTINRGVEHLLFSAAALDKKTVVVIDGDTNELRLVAGTAERIRGSGAAVRAVVTLSPTVESRKVAALAYRFTTNGVPLSVRIAPAAGPPPR